VALHCRTCTSCTYIRGPWQVLSAREYQAEFWAELALKSPSLARLDTIGLSIEKAMSGADAGFKRLLQLNPNSVPVMRRYAQFLAEVTNNAGRAEQLSQQADDLEEMLAKEFADRSAQVPQSHYIPDSAAKCTRCSCEHARRVVWGHRGVVFGPCGETQSPLQFYECTPSLRCVTWTYMRLGCCLARVRRVFVGSE
jgi:hypothetical protein